MDTKNPQYIKGYWRNKKAEEPKKDGGALLAGLMLAAVVIEVAVLLWRYTLALALIAGIAYGTIKYLKWLNDPHRLRINYLGGEAWYKRPLVNAIGAGYRYQKITLTAALAGLVLNIKR